MKSKHKLLLTVATVTAMGGALLVSSPALANGQGLGEGRIAAITQRIAEEFGLNQDEVQAVFEEMRQEHQAERATRIDERLSELVAAGDITAEQKELILAKHEELRATHQDMKAELDQMSPEERRQAMEARRQELEDWAAENGIDAQYLRFGHGPGKGRGAGKGPQADFEVDSV